MSIVPRASRALLVAVGGVVTVSVASQERIPLPESLDACLAVVKRQEAVALFIRGKGIGQYTVERGGQLVRGGETVVAFLREGDPNGRSLLDYEMMPVVSYEKGEYWSKSLVRGFDGKTDWSWDRSVMLEGRDRAPIPERSAEVSLIRSPSHGNEGCTGWSATLPGFFHQQGAYFSEILERGDIPFHVRADPEGRRVLLICEAKDGRSTDEWDLAAEWNFCLRSFVRRDIRGNEIKSVRIESAIRLHQHFWYPSRVVFVTAQGPSGRNQRLDLSLEDVRLEAEVADEEFAPRFPHGTIVQDRISGDVVTVAAPDVELTRRITTEAAQMQLLVAYEPKRPQGLWRVLGIVLTILGIGLFWRGWLRRRTKERRLGGRKNNNGPRAVTARPGAILLLLLSAVPPAGAQGPACLQFIRGCRGDNCAVNAAVFASSYWGKTVDVAVAAGALGCSDRRLESIGLDRLESVLRKWGLGVEGFRFADLDSVHDRCVTERAIAIVHVATGAPSGHYYIVGPWGDGLVVANPGEGVQRREKGSRFLRDLAEAFTGNGLIVRRVDGVAPWRIDQAGVTSLDLGSVAAREIVETVRVRNGGDSAVTLESADSSCGCFRSAELRPDKLGAGEEGDLVVRINGSQVAAGASRQSVGLRFRGGAGAVNCLLTIATHGRITEEFTKAGVVPSLARAEVVHDGVAMAFVEVVVPDGGSVVKWRGSTGVTAAQSTVRSLRSGVGCRYRIDWQGERAWVDFLVRDAVGKDTSLRCHLRARRDEEANAAHGEPR